MAGSLTSRSPPKRLEPTVHPGDERAAIDGVFGARLVRSGVCPIAVFFRELGKFLAEPEEADLLFEVRILELLLEVEVDRVRALVRERAVHVRGSGARRARDDEEVPRALSILPPILDDLHRVRVELLRIL